MYKQATKTGLRFNSSKGQLSVEDLWNLPLTSRTKPSLDGIAIAVDSQIQALGRNSFVTPKDSVDEGLELQLNILKDIIETRQADNAGKLTAAATLQTRDRIRQIIAGKKDEALAGKTVEELEALLT